MAGSLIAPLRRAFDAHARRPALEGEHWRLDYRDLAHDAAALAAALHALGVRPGHQVPMALPRSPQMIVGVVAVLRCGAAWAPLDLANPPERLAAMLARLDSPIVLVGPGVTLPAPHGDRAVALDDLLARAAAPESAPAWPDCTGDELACVMFTSGTTGVPKAVMIPQRGIARLVLDTDYASFRPDARWAHAASPAFDAALLEVWAPLLHGACCVVQETPLPALHVLAEFLVERRVTDAWLTAALFNTMVDEELASLGGLRQLLTGGETMSPAHARACLARWPRLALLNGYGPTENTTFSLVHRVRPEDVATGAPVPIGRPIAGTTVRVVPPDDADADAHEGELWLGGEGLALGYLGAPELTAQRFVADAAGARWYRSGDRVTRRADGAFDFLGRLDRQVKLRGHRVDLDRLEALLASAPGVVEAAVAVVGDTADTRRLVAAVGTGPATAEVGALRDWLSARVAPAALPERWIVRPRLPQSLTGKLDRAAIEAAAAAPVSATTDGAPVLATPPASATERVLHGLWSRVLAAAVPEDRHADFHALGGESMAALRLAADVARALRRRVSPVDLLRVSRLDAQARLVDTAPRIDAGADDEGVDEASRAEGHPVDLSEEQLAMLHAEALDPAGLAYHVQQAWRLAQGLDRARLDAGLRALAARHPALRLAWRHDPRRTRAWRLSRPPADLVRDHGPLAADPASGAWPEPALRVLRTPLDPPRDGAWRVDRWTLPGGGMLLAWTVHHVAIDAWSLERLRIELDQWLRGEPWPEAPAPADVVPIDEAGLRRQAARLSGKVPGRRPGTLSRAPGPGAERVVSLPASLGPAVQAFARAAGVTPFVPLLAAWGLALQRVLGPDAGAVLVPFAKRRGPDADRVVGFHLDLRVVEAGVQEGESPAALLARVHDEIREARGAWRRPLARLAEALDALAPGRREALAGTAFTWLPERDPDFSLAGIAARELPVPPASSRFVLALHVTSPREAPDRLEARVEALQALWDDGRAGAAATAFAEALEALCALPPASIATASAPAPALEAATVPPALRAAAATAWRDLLGESPTGPEDDFLQRGGGSLLATRLAARLRRETGRDVDLAAFLAAPRFGALCAALAQAPGGDARARGLLRLGPANARRVVLMLPGGAGGPLGLYTLAEALRARLPDDWAVAIADLTALMDEAPEPPTGEHFAARLAQLARELGPDRLAGVAGFSLGGLMALDVGAALRANGTMPPPLCLIDTWSPASLALSGARRWSRLASQALRAPDHLVERLRLKLRGPQPGTVEADPQFPRWRALMDQMSSRAVPGEGLDVTLIHSRAEVRASGLWRHVRTNGFDPAAFARLATYPMPYAHLALLREGAAEVAEAIAKALG